MYGEKVKGISPNLKSFKPLNMKIFDEKYKIIKKIYTNGLAAGEIVLLEDNMGNKFAGKDIQKKKLKNNYFHEFIKNEFAIQYSLCHSPGSENIVRVEEYFEDDQRYLMIMEYSSEPSYFDDMLENVLYYFTIIH